MEWTTCFSDDTIGRNRSTKGPRSHYQIDFDRLIFSSAFRRLQSKTQVFPLPGTSFVHNRLTHSLEVASVGRSLGAIVGAFLAEEEISPHHGHAQNFYRVELANVISAACLAHDVGNPAFGHSGEEAISNYFRENKLSVIDGRQLHSYYQEQEWNDLVNFEGNANALRVLTKSYPGKGKGGLGLTLTTLASILKYPCESRARDRSYKHRKKYGFFWSDKKLFSQVVEQLGMHADYHSDYVIYKRHPYVYLVEAADDICYNIIDMEDAHRLGILSRSVIEELLIELISQIGNPDDNIHAIKENFIRLTDDNAAISYLRSKVINALVHACSSVFIENRKGILAGDFNSTLIDEIEAYAPQLRVIKDISLEKIYRHKSVIEIEIAGYNVMSSLLQLYIPAVLSSNLNPKQKAALRLLPAQYYGKDSNSPYEKSMLILDHVSAMTDDFAAEQYRKLNGIEISKHT